MTNVYPWVVRFHVVISKSFLLFLHWVTEMESGLHEIDLDDFLFAGADKTSNCSKLMNTFTEVCSQLDVPIADDKTEGPSTRITYLGLLIDT